MALFHMLIGDVIVGTDDIEEWGEWFKNPANRRIALDTINGVDVSTVFLGVDHGFFGASQMFETMVFAAGNEVLDELTERCATLEEAQEQHRQVVERVKETLAATEAERTTS